MPFDGLMTRKAKGAADDADHLDSIHAKLWENSRFRTVYRISILANFHNLLVVPKLEKDFDILRDEFNILFCLAEAGPMTGTDVCRITGRPRNSVSRCAERLIQRKLINARAGETDKRMTSFAILPAGRKLYASMLPLFEDGEEKMFSGLTASERNALDKILAKLVSQHSKWDRIL